MTMMPTGRMRALLAKRRTPPQDEAPEVPDVPDQSNADRVHEAALADPETQDINESLRQSLGDPTGKPVARGGMDEPPAADPADLHVPVYSKAARDAGMGLQVNRFAHVTPGDMTPALEGRRAGFLTPDDLNQSMGIQDVTKESHIVPAAPAQARRGPPAVRPSAGAPSPAPAQATQAPPQDQSKAPTDTGDYGGSAPQTPPPDAARTPVKGAGPAARDGEMADAQNEAWQLRLISAIGRRGQQFSTAGDVTGRARPDNAYWDKQDQEAEHPIQELLGRRAAAKAARQEQHGLDREALGDTRYTAEQTEGKRRFDEGAKEKQREFDTTQTANTLHEGTRQAHEKRMEDLELQKLALEREKVRQGGKGGAKAERNVEQDNKELAKRTQMGAETKNDLDTVNGYVARGGQIPGVGGVKSLVQNIPVVGNWLSSPDDVHMHQALSRIASNIVYMKSGKAVNEAERAGILKQYGIFPGQTREQTLQGIAAMSRDAKQAMGNVESGFEPEVVARRKQRGGVTAADFPEPAREGGAGGHPQDAEALAWAKKNPRDPRAADILRENGH